MKRFLALILILALLLPITACTVERVPEIESPYLYYYRTAEIGYDSERGVICPERREVNGHENDLNWILAEYFSGPKAETLVSPFPKGMNLIYCVLKDGVLTVQVSQSFADLVGIDLSIAAACIAATCFENPAVEEVSITVPKGLLDGKKSINLRRKDIILRDSSADMKQTTLALYFADQSGRYLIGEEVTVGLATMENPGNYLMQKLVEGPRDSELAPVLPEGTRLLETRIEDGICNVNLSREFTQNASKDPLMRRLSLLAIANILTQLDSVSGVEIYEEGTLLTSYGIWNLNAPLTGDENAVGPVRTGMNEIDVDLYLPLEGQKLLGRIPARIRQTASETPVELLVTALIQYKSANWVKNPFPEGVKLLSVRQLGNVCVVDVSKEILGSVNLEASILSIIATVSAYQNGGFVKVTVEGKTPEGDFGSLFSAVSFQEEWVIS